MLNPHRWCPLKKMVLMMTCHPIICLILLNFASATTQLDLSPIPQLCDPIQCPAEADMQCPEDSAIREIHEMNAVDLLSSNSMGSTNAPIATTEKMFFNSSMMPDELFAQCCLSKKCICKTCYIPDCNSNEGEVVVELQPEAMDTPGQCCGQYECKLEPNCTEVWDTEFYWLQSCQRCQCTSGARICEQSCDEGTNGICESKNRNEFFKDGESWNDGCYQCECVNGEQKCVIALCSPVNCPSERQVHLKDSCCPVCWPKGEPMPHEKSNSYDDGYGYGEQRPKEEHLEAIADTEWPLTTTTTVATTASSTQQAALITHPSSTAPPPCQVHDFPKVVEVVHEDNFQVHFYQFVICVLVGTAILELYYIIRLRAKQRSYRPVSNFDDKV